MTSFQIFKSLVHQGWLGFRRAHYFQRSMGIKALMFFVAIVFLWYAYLLGMMLPSLLQQIFPDKEAHEAFFSIWLYAYAADLTMRLFLQKLPKQLIQSYLTLPVGKSTLAGYILARSWFSIYNLYLFALLIPFYKTALQYPLSGQAFWLAILGSTLLAGINHAIITWAKTWPSRTMATMLPVFLIALTALFGIVINPSQFMAFSEQVGKAFISGNIWVFTFPAAIIGLLQYLSHRGLCNSFYDWSGTTNARVHTGASFPEQLFARVPVYGLFWQLEWRLITRNKRSKGGLRQWPLVIIGLPLFFYFDPFDNASMYTYLLVMVAGGYGFFHLQYTFSWESRFFDLIASRQTDIHEFVRAKYYFYLALGLLQILPVLIILLFFRPDLAGFLAGMFLYVTGPVFAFLMHTGIGSSTRIDPNKRASFNFEGTSGTLFVVVFVSMFSVIILMGLAYMLPLATTTGLALLTGGSGLIFILLHKVWIKAIAKQFLRKKYHNLTKYRG